MHPESFSACHSVGILSGAYMMLPNPASEVSVMAIQEVLRGDIDNVSS